MANKLTDEQIEKNKEMVDNMIDLMPEPRRSKMMEMFEGMVGFEFYMAPASSRENYHACFPGGLCDHSIRVTQNLHEIAKVLAPKQYSSHTLNFVGLVHDLGKVGDGTKPYFKILEGQDNLWRRKRGELYETNKELVYMPTSDRTIFVLNRYGISMSDEEFQAIRISDGQYAKSNVEYSMQETDLALLLHFADRWACAQEKQLE
jgi:hypothetical protein